MTGGAAATARQRLHGAEVRVRVLELRRRGHTLREIGAKLGVSRQTAHRHLVKALDELAAEARELATNLRELEAERLDEMLLGLWPAATSGDCQAVAAAVRISERRARLFGLDQPSRSEVSGPNGKPMRTYVDMIQEIPDYSRLSDDELAQLEVLATKLVPEGSAS